MRRNDLPEEVLRQASDRLKRQTALTTMAVGRRVWTSPVRCSKEAVMLLGRVSGQPFDALPRPCRWPAEAFVCSWSTSAAPAGRFDVEPFLVSAEE